MWMLLSTAAANTTTTTTTTTTAAAAGAGAEFSPTSFSWDFRHPVCTSIPIHMGAQYLFLARDMIIFLALYL